MAAFIIKNVGKVALLIDADSLFNSAITGLFVGAGSTIGTWLVTRHFLKHLETLEEELKQNSK